MEKTVHKAGWTKQQNKPHKSKFRSKGETNRQQKTKKDGEIVYSASAQQSKQTRKLRAKQIAQNKRQAALQQNRIGHVNSSHADPPRVIAIVGMSSSVQIQPLYDQIVSTLLSENENQKKLDETKKSIGGLTLHSAKFKTRVTLYPAYDRDLMTILDIGKVADILLLVTHASDCLNNKEIVDAQGTKIISLMKEQGLPTVMGIVQGLSTIENKYRTPCKKACAEYFEGNFYTKARVLPSENDADYAQIVRFMCEQPVVPLNWRKFRPYVLVDTIHWEPNENATDKFGTLQISGFLRGNKLNPNNILHIVGYGDAQVIKIVGGADPYSVKQSHHKKDGSMITDTQMEDVVLAESDENRETLERENPFDPFAAEQTWPTPEELQANEKASKVELKTVPKGTSRYQASWIPDLKEEGEEDDDDEDDDEDDGIQIEGEKKEKKSNTYDDEDIFFDEDEMKDNKKQAVLNNDSEDEFGEDFDETGTFAMVSMKRKKNEENEEDLEEELKEYQEFPDEMDTPLNELARIRFRKYRGLKSFRTSPWDPKENLPTDYSRIFQFENFRCTQKRILKNHSGVEEGLYITIHVKDIASDQFASHPANRPLLVCGLHKYENKMSVLNMNITTVGTYTKPIKSTQRVLAQVGFRRFDAFPVYSDISIKGDKFKVNKFLIGTAMASVYAPISFAPTPVLFFSAETSELIAIGNVSTVNPDRIMLKKVVLSGVPLRVGKTKAIVKDMFFNADDVHWFKPVDLWTKYGKSGRILESIGTKGHMKCVFDAFLTQQDTIMMSLYKRIFPKWSILPELQKKPEQQ